MIRRITPSVVLAAVLVGVIAGVALASYVSATWLLVGGLTVMIGGVAAYVRRLLITLLFVIGVGLGVMRYDAVQPAGASVAHHLAYDAVVEGTIVRTDISSNSQHIVVNNLIVNQSAVDDRALVYIPRFPTARAGDRITFHCDFTTPEPFDGFAYDRYLATKRIYATCSLRDAPLLVASNYDTGLPIRLERFRRFLITRIEHTFGEPQASLLAGLLLGAKEFSDEWTERFVVTGTSHIVAASGSNVALVSSTAFFVLISLGFWKRRASFFLIAGIAAYAVLAGGEAAIVRASVMGILVVISQHNGRRASPHNLILLAVASMLMVEPRLLRDDVGFQLSVASTLGLIAWTTRVTQRLQFVPTTFGVRESLASTIAATMATLPIVIVSFGSVSIVAPIVNLLVLPAIPLAMLFGAVATVCASAWLSGPAWALMTYQMTIIRAFADLPFASIAVPSALKYVIACGVGVAVILLMRRWRLSIKTPEISDHTIPVIVPAALVVTLVVPVFFRSPGQLTVWVFNIGQGDAIFIDGPKEQILVDGGPDDLVVEKLSSVMPFWDKTLDATVLTHDHADHFMGLQSVAGRFHVDRSLGASSTAPGDILELGGGATLEVLWPPETFSSSDPNEESVVLLLTYGETSMLFTGDAGVSEEISWKLERVDVLKAGHHGSDTSTGEELLQTISAEYAVISCGTDNDYGHPSPFVVERLERFGVTTYRTDLHGDVRISSDGGEPIVDIFPL